MRPRPALMASIDRVPSRRSGADVAVEGWKGGAHPFLSRPGHGANFRAIGRGVRAAVQSGQDRLRSINVTRWSPRSVWRSRCSRIGHLSGRESGLFDYVVQGALGGAPGGGDWGSSRDVGWELGVEFGEGGVDDSRVGLGEEHGQSASIAGQLVALGARDPLDESLASETPEVVGHVPRAVTGDEPGDWLTQRAVRQPGAQVLEGAQAGKQR